MTKGMKIISVVLLGSLAMILSANAAPFSPANAYAGKKLSEIIPKQMYSMLRRMAKDVDKKLDCLEGKKVLAQSIIDELRDVVGKIARNLPPTDPELYALIKSFDDDPRVVEHLPTFLKHIMDILMCANKP